jgi:hypothetical protein
MGISRRMVRWCVFIAECRGGPSEVSTEGLFL